jgi:ectoine hydroxylase-related dioxygenase (phytanoyl-CoA dioxygenase family)
MSTISRPVIATDRVPEVDMSERDVELADVQAFRRAGIIALRNLLDRDELAEVQAAGEELVEWSWTTQLGGDVVWTAEPGTAGAAPIRVEYVLDKSRTMRILAGHPRLLAAAEAFVGPNFFPTWDSLVFKTEAGAPRLAWHRDGGLYRLPAATTGMGRVIDVGIYLDDAPEDNCVWCLPGTQYWTEEEATDAAAARNETEFDTTDAIPAVMRAGDVLVHNILTLHAAPATTGSRRRVVYYEYRPAELEWELGPHTREYVGLKQQVLLACIEEREASGREGRFEYRPAPAMRKWADHPPISSYRFPHEEYWTWTDRGP